MSDDNDDQEISSKHVPSLDTPVYQVPASVARAECIERDHLPASITGPHIQHVASNMPASSAALAEAAHPSWTTDDPPIKRQAAKKQQVH